MPGFPLFVSLSRKEQTIFPGEHGGDCQSGDIPYFAAPDVDACATLTRSAGIDPGQLPHA